jgi:hypothetical protein
MRNAITKKDAKKMTAKRKATRHGVTRSSGNVFADLGLPMRIKNF